MSNRSTIGMALILLLAPPVAAQEALPPRFEGRSVHRLPLPPGQGCFVTTDRVRAERFWDPHCEGQGAGIRPPAW